MIAVANRQQDLTAFSIEKPFGVIFSASVPGLPVPMNPGDQYVCCGEEKLNSLAAGACGLVICGVRLAVVGLPHAQSTSAHFGNDLQCVEPVTYFPRARAPGW